MCAQPADPVYRAKTGVDVYHPKAWVVGQGALHDFDGIFGGDQNGLRAQLLDISLAYGCMISKGFAVFKRKAQPLQHCKKAMWLPNTCHGLAGLGVLCLPGSKGQELFAV